MKGFWLVAIVQHIVVGFFKVVYCSRTEVGFCDNIKCYIGKQNEQWFHLGDIV